MDKSSDPTAPKNQTWTDAPDAGLNAEGDIVTDSTESTDQHSEWESSGDLATDADAETPSHITDATDDGYSSGPSDFEASAETSADELDSI